MCQPPAFPVLLPSPMGMGDSSPQPPQSPPLQWVWVPVLRQCNMQCNAMQCKAMQCNQSMHCNAMQLQCNAMQPQSHTMTTTYHNHRGRGGACNHAHRPIPIGGEGGLRTGLTIPIGVEGTGRG